MFAESRIRVGPRWQAQIPELRTLNDQQSPRSRAIKVDFSDMTTSYTSAGWNKSDMMDEWNAEKFLRLQRKRKRKKSEKYAPPAWRSSKQSSTPTRPRTRSITRASSSSSSPSPSPQTSPPASPPPSSHHRSELHTSPKEPRTFWTPPLQPPGAGAYLATFNSQMKQVSTERTANTTDITNQQTTLVVCLLEAEARRRLAQKQQQHPPPLSRVQRPTYQPIRVRPPGIKPSQSVPIKKSSKKPRTSRQRASKAVPSLNVSAQMVNQKRSTKMNAYLPNSLPDPQNIDWSIVAPTMPFKTMIDMNNCSPPSRPNFNANFRAPASTFDANFLNFPTNYLRRSHFVPPFHVDSACSNLKLQIAGKHAVRANG